MLQHILTGYRFLPTPSACWHSLTYVHNETGNIYTHLLGFFFFLGLGIYELFYSNSLASVPNFDRIVFGIFFIAACKCLMCSTVWHTLSGINDYDIFKRMACLDYVGISVLISASVVLLEYYGFYCNDVWRNTYITGTSILSVIGICMPFSAWFNLNGKWFYPIIWPLLQPRLLIAPRFIYCRIQVVEDFFLYCLGCLGCTAHCPSYNHSRCCTHTQMVVTSPLFNGILFIWCFRLW